MIDANDYVNRLPVHERCVVQTVRGPSEVLKSVIRCSSLLKALSTVFNGP